MLITGEKNSPALAADAIETGKPVVEEYRKEQCEYGKEISISWQTNWIC